MLQQFPRLLWLPLIDEPKVLVSWESDRLAEGRCLQFLPCVTFGYKYASYSDSRKRQSCCTNDGQQVEDDVQLGRCSCPLLLCAALQLHSPTQVT